MRLKQKVYKFFIRQLKQHKDHPSGYFALSVAVGIFFGISPIIGQTFLCFLFWAFLRLFKIHFNLIVACTLTLLTNPATTPFFCYFYYITGQFLLGSEALLFSSFIIEFNRIFSQDISVRTVWDVFINLVKGFGMPILYGYLVWSALASGTGYFLSYRFVVYWRNRKSKKKNPA